MDGSLMGALGLGLLLGVRHAMDADHVAAVSTLVSRHRSVGRSCLLGAFWGAGHTVALFVAGVAVIAFKVSISPRVEQDLERAVACLLILLGGHVLLRSVGRWVLHRHAHTHGNRTHDHLHLRVGAEDSGHVHLLGLGSRPFLVGLLHGLAGSAALTLLVLGAMPSAIAGLLYILLFGVGSTVGMFLLSGLMGLPFAATAGRSPRTQVAIQGLAGAVSLFLGLALVSGFGV